MTELEFRALERQINREVLRHQIITIAATATVAVVLITLAANGVVVALGVFASGMLASKLSILYSKSKRKKLKKS